MDRFDVHVSDLRTFKSCRRKWDWSSPLRRHLEPNRTPIHFTIGRGVHWALAQFYEAGIVPQAAFDLFMQKYRAQEGVWWEGSEDKLTEAETLGRTIVTNYLHWVRSMEQPDEEWDVVATEIKYETPLERLPDWPDDFQPWLTGRMDAVIRNKRTGALWLRELKTSKRMPDEEWLRFDDQAAGYCGAIAKILGEPVLGIQYRFLMKSVPEKPRVLQNGSFSKAIHSNLSTTYELYHQALEERAAQIATGQALQPMGHPLYEEKYGMALRQLEAEYATVLRELRTEGWAKYFIEFNVRKTDAELKSTLQGFSETAWDMYNSPHVYTAPDWLKCTWCAFKEPCTLKTAGGNYEAHLQELFGARKPEIEPIEEDEL